jgi:formiminotetrahydrofolate cyclodeaminase
MDYSEKSCEVFVQALASKEPVPGGGGASALVGAIGMALGNMVGSLTLNKKKYADVQEDIMDLKEKADDVQCELLKLIAKDADAFKPLSAAYGLPKDTDLQRAEKARVMEKALKDACAVTF